jgi:hypothetical protein
MPSLNLASRRIQPEIHTIFWLERGHHLMSQSGAAILAVCGKNRQHVGIIRKFSNSVALLEE